MMRRCAAGGGAATKIKNIKRFIRTDSIYCDFLFCVVGDGTHEIYIDIGLGLGMGKKAYGNCVASHSAQRSQCTEDVLAIIAFCYKSPFECNGDNRVVRSAANCDNNRSHKMQDFKLSRICV